MILFLLDNRIRESYSTTKYRPHTVVFGNIDRNMNPMSMKKVIREFAKDPDMSDTQLIAATNECSLLQELCPVEVKLMDKNDEGAQIIRSLAEYPAVSKDRVYDMYLEGKFGAVPKTTPIDRDDGAC